MGLFTTRAPKLVKGVRQIGHHDGINSSDMPVDIWAYGGRYPFPTSVQTTTIVSDVAEDNAAGGGARAVEIHGLDSNYSEISETVTMTGTTAIVMANKYLRINEIEVSGVGSAEWNMGNISVAHGATTIGYIHSGGGHCEAAIYTVSADYDFATVEGWYASLYGILTPSAHMEFQTRTNSGAWLTRMTAQISENAPLNYQALIREDYATPLDIRVRCRTLTINSSGIVGGFAISVGNNA